MLGLGLDLWSVPILGGATVDTTPGGANDVLLLESGDGLLMEDGTSFFLLEG